MDTLLDHQFARLLSEIQIGSKNPLWDRDKVWKLIWDFLGTGKSKVWGSIGVYPQKTPNFGDGDGVITLKMFLDTLGTGKSQMIIRGQSWRSKEIADSAWFETDTPKPGPYQKILFYLRLWPLIFLQPSDQNQCLVPHLKDLIEICLEPKAQGHGMNFKVCNLKSRQPHLCSTYLVSVASQLHTIVTFGSVEILLCFFSLGLLLKRCYAVI